MRTKLPHVGALDGVRAVAVTGVLLYHGGLSWLPGGFLGVDVFFVLSGFLITSLLLAERRDSGRIDLLRFWTRRARRLLPAAFVMVAACLVVVAVFFGADAARTRGDALASFAYLNNWHQILTDRSYFASFGRPSPLQHLWSLAVEEQFYLLWPLGLGLALTHLGRGRTALVTLALAAGSAVAMAILAGPDPSRVYYGTDTHAAGLLTGALLAFAWPLGRFRTPARTSAVWLLDAAGAAGLVGVLAAMATVRDYDPWTYRGGIAGVGLAAGLLVAAVSHPACRVGAALAVAPLRWIGARSYGIYLWHWPVMALIRIPLVLQIAAAVLLAAASYRWVEQPVRTGAARAWLDRRAPRHRLGIALGTATALLLTLAVSGGRAGGARASAALAGVTHTAAARSPLVSARAHPATRPRRAKPLAVGASVMLAARAALGRHATVDAAVGRPVADILARLETYRAAGRLPSRVVVQIGENGPLWSDDVKQLRRVLAGVRRVVLVNVRVPRSWGPEVNDTLAQAVRGWRAARLADWYDASAGADLLYDGTHPNPRGQRVFAHVVERALR